jgi:hypothetical protein
MDMYPAYTVVSILDMYAVTFLALLNEGYRVRHQRYQMLAQISDLPHMERSSHDNFYKQLEWAATPASDILGSSGNGSTDAEIKKALGG